jgi:hypothetical protein
MKCVDPTKPYRKSGGMRHPALVRNADQPSFQAVRGANPTHVS